VVRYGHDASEDIEKAVEQLCPQNMARFREWFGEFDARLFDARIERDARAGKLDALRAAGSRQPQTGCREER
jgi:hypothetical protein